MIITFNRHNKASVRAKTFTSSMPLLTAIHNSKTCGSREATATAIILQKCGVKTNLEGQECHIMKANLELLPGVIRTPG